MHNTTYMDPNDWRTYYHTGGGGVGVEENDLDLDEGNERLCGVCSLPIFSTPYYPIIINNNNHPQPVIFLHKSCSPYYHPQLPQVLTHHPLHPGSPLHLHNAPHPDAYYCGTIICNNCREECQSSSFYQCRDEYCRFALAVKCTKPVKVVHRSHTHELTFVPRRDNLLDCGACGMQHKGLFYCCDFCQFNLHQQCALLPNIILHTNHEDMHHPLALTFLNASKRSHKFRRSDKCSICKQQLSSINSGVYFCLRCDAAIHVKCADLSDSTNFRKVSSEDTAKVLPHFPMKNEQTSLMMYLWEHSRHSHSDTAGIEEEEGKKLLLKNEEEILLHDHELVLLYDDNNSNKYYCLDDDDEPARLLCDACIQPVSPPFYTCPQCFDFYLHICCANLTSSSSSLSSFRCRRLRCEEDKPLMKLTSRLYNIQSVSGRPCDGCGFFSNGFFFTCQKCGWGLDLRCGVLPNAITYELHGNKSHILFLSYSPFLYYYCACCLYGDSSLYYVCGSCPNFQIDVGCALLPTSVSHKYDRHPLELTPSRGLASKDDSSSSSSDEINFCEICEKGMDSEKWWYNCKECATSFHIDCIPCVARYSSKSKTAGRTIRVGCHISCPLTCVQTLTNYSYTCGVCQDTIEGKTDGLAFECTKCAFWLDLWCAECNLVAD